MATGGPLVPRCGYSNCRITNPRISCSRCKVQHYCTVEHQAAGLAFHESLCIKASESLEKMVLEELKLRNMPRDIFTRFSGSLWRTSNSYNYLAARSAYIEQLRQIKTHSSVIAQLDHVMDDLRLNGRGGMGSFHLAPFLMLRLDKDQEAYDFIKWRMIKRYLYNTLSPDVTVSLSTVKNADCFEDIDCFKSDSYYSFAINLATAAFLKIKMLLDLILLQKSTDGNEIPSTMPAEIFNCIRYYLVRSPVIASRKDIMEDENQETRIKKLVAQVRTLIRAVHRDDHFFWPYLLSNATLLFARPEVLLRTVHSLDRRFIVDKTYDAWMEMPEAFEVIRNVMRDKLGANTSLA